MIFFRLGVEPQRAKALHRLERKLGVRFRRLSLLHQSLIHRSFAAASSKKSALSDNEVLEFFGDAVLGLVISEELFRHWPHLEVGEMAKIKSQVVSRFTCAEAATGLGLDEWILLGPGELARGEGRRSSVIGSALEAVLGAVYVDRGLAVATQLIRRLFKEKIKAVQTGEVESDYKSALQEYALRYFKVTPEYRVVEESGPSHRRRFRVSVGWRGKTFGHGIGLSKKAASQEAARKALEQLT